MPICESPVCLREPRVRYLFYSEWYSVCLEHLPEKVYWNRNFEWL
jgi:hypothetical protein